VATATGATTLCVLCVVCVVCVECPELVACRGVLETDVAEVCNAVLSGRVGEVEIMVDVEEP
jgi:hypothetical protein